MRVAILEDNTEHRDVIANYISSTTNGECDLVFFGSFLEVAINSKNIFECDLIILDFFVPPRANEEAGYILGDLREFFDQNDLRKLKIIAISSQPSEIEPDDDLYLRSRGIVVHDYNDEASWKSSIDRIVEESTASYFYEFICFTALEEEVLGFFTIEKLNPHPLKLFGLKAWKVTIHGKNGIIFLLSRVGLVDAGISVARVLSNLKPKVAFMTGICGGIGEAEMGQVLLTSTCWEYQSGKWTEDYFKNEPYQVSVNSSLLTDFHVFLEKNPKLIRDLEEKMPDFDRPKRPSKPISGIIASGSAVVAREDIRDMICDQHRHVNGVDMEIYAFHRAVELSDCNCLAFSLKTVVDKADHDKSDDFHDYGCAISALLSVELLQICLPTKQSQ